LGSGLRILGCSSGTVVVVGPDTGRSDVDVDVHVHVDVDVDAAG
jgi:hypothetical protein